MHGAILSISCVCIFVCTVFMRPRCVHKNLGVLQFVYVSQLSPFHVGVDLTRDKRWSAILGACALDVHSSSGARMRNSLNVFATN